MENPHVGRDTGVKRVDHFEQTIEQCLVKGLAVLVMMIPSRDEQFCAKGGRRPYTFEQQRIRAEEHGQIGRKEQNYDKNRYPVFPVTKVGHAS